MALQQQLLNGDFMTRDQYINNLFSTYELVSVLSSKNDCKVLRLRNKRLGRDIVLRSYSSTVAAYELISDINCENLPLIYDVKNLDDGQIVLEEFIDGMNVSQIMEAEKYRYKSAKKVILGICNALYALHSLSIVHRDIKPENVMIDKNGRVVLIDLNASRKVSASSRDTVIMGTVGYVSPEQLGISQSDARTDIYSLGVMLNVMITGIHPSSKMAKGRIGKIVRKCTSLNPDERFQSAEKLAHAFNIF